MTPALSDKLLYYSSCRCSSCRPYTLLRCLVFLHISYISSCRAWNNMDDIARALTTLEALASQPGSSASGLLQSLLDQHFTVARERLQAGSDPRAVIQELITAVGKSKKEVEKGLKGWYGALGGVGKAVEKVGRTRTWAVRGSSEFPICCSADSA